MVAHRISVARHTAERISSKSPILLFQSVLQFMRPDSGPAESISRNGLQIPNSQVQEHEGLAFVN